MYLTALQVDSRVLSRRIVDGDPLTPLSSAAEQSPVAARDAVAESSLLRFQLNAIYGHMASASVISTVAALSLAMFLTPTFGSTATRTWFVMKGAVALGRFVLAQAYRANRFKEQPQTANLLMMVSLALDGLIWGFAGVWGSGASGVVVALLVACLSCVAMLATFGLQVRRAATAAYVVPMLVPLAIALAVRWDAVGAFTAVGTILVLVQTLVTGYASEKRLSGEFLARDETARALGERSAALEQASKVSKDLEKALEQVRRQSAVKALFLGTMSHELRTPLHGILGVAELLQRDARDVAVRHKLDLIIGSGGHLLGIIGALLDISRIDSGHLELHSAPFDLAAELHDLNDIYTVRGQAKGIGFEAELDLELPCWVNGDAARVRQILHNLLGNALKFTQRGLVRLSVKRDGDVVRFEVADTGAGIAAADMARIFEAFRQVDETAARPADGTGLGLTIAREIAQAMGGNIEVSSELGKGSQFVFTARLDAIAPENVPSHRTADRDERSRGPLVPAGVRVLLAEDNDVNALIAEAHLAQSNVRPLRAVNGQEAFEEATNNPRPDLVLMDCRMPVMDGASAAREIRRWEKTHGVSAVPIIALTASATAEERLECEEAGMDGFLQKPFSSDQLQTEIQRVLAASIGPRMAEDHPLYQLSLALGELEADALFGSNTVH
jgi:two-component system, sensor histidine kinase